MNIRNFLFNNNTNKKLSGRLHFNGKPGREAVIFSHGLFSTKEGNKIKKLAEPIVNKGYTLMTFDFRFCGESGNNISDFLIMDELQDLLSAIEYLKSIGVEKVHLMGSSIGGLISILGAASGKYDIESLILIATPTILINLPGDIDEEEIHDLDPSGYRSYKGVLLNHGFFKELVSINVREALLNLSCPVLAIHGSEDSVVSIDDYNLIKENVLENFKGKIIEGGDHRLFKDNDFKQLTEEIIQWLGK